MRDIFDQIDKYYSYPTKPKLVAAIEERVFYRLADCYRQTNTIPEFVTLEPGEYRAVREFVDEVEMWLERTGTENPWRFRWKAKLILPTPWGDVELREGK